MGRMTVTFARLPLPGERLPDVGDVFEDDDTGTIRRIDAIRSVTRGPYVGRRFVVQFTRITPGEVPGDAETFYTSRDRR